MPLKLVTREQWNALPPKKVIPLSHPITKVSFTYTEPRNVFDIDTVRLVQKAQRNTLFLDDIEANFIIGRDGTVYEGRGWHAQPTRHTIEDIGGDYLQIAIIGNLEGQKETHPSFVALKELLNLGREKKFIQEQFAFLGYTKEGMKEIDGRFS